MNHHGVLRDTSSVYENFDSFEKMGSRFFLLAGMPSDISLSLQSQSIFFSINSRRRTRSFTYLKHLFLSTGIFTPSLGNKFVVTDNIRRVIRGTWSTFEDFVNPVKFTLTTVIASVMLARFYRFLFFLRVSVYPGE